MKVKIDMDEWYPVYSLLPLEKFGDEVEIPDELWERWQKCEAEFDALQDELRVIWKAMS